MTPAIEVSTDAGRIDRALVHRYLSQESYWARGIDRATLDRALDHSLCFGAFAQERQVGFARVITDRATFGYVADVFVLPEWRGRGVAQALMRAIDAYPALQRLRRMALVTRDAHGLYARCGFKPLASPERWMERHNPDVYAANADPEAR
ncbi:GNAT family N-acetyltransferase [Betaproteobacteria bacterium PRO7]|jgi:GNAT superfamily N-acetyltransferase|nr:GNAT family N-acetyltransferase [Betaproteobacteria bacterium PRO7]GIL05255.1 MAG: N-acetyltransferase [Betaproteobacteria bacterium]